MSTNPVAEPQQHPQEGVVDDDQGDEPAAMAEAIAAINAGTTRERLEYAMNRLEAILLITQETAGNDDESLSGSDAAAIEVLAKGTLERIRQSVDELAERERTQLAAAS